MLETRSMGTVDPELAGRLALTLASLPGVEGALISSLEGELLAESAIGDASRSAALATFLACRAEALPLEDDQRGMGRLLTGSQFDCVAISGERGDAVVLAPGACFVLLALGRGAPAEPAVTAARQFLRRYL
jgi:predicted regulator of Ras-like GTPase activity (Roadblock/LC7/MglB family)